VQAANPYLTFVGEPLLVDWSQDEWAGGCYSAWDNESWQFVDGVFAVEQQSDHIVGNQLIVSCGNCVIGLLSSQSHF
jgi:hypothetical protein